MVKAYPECINHELIPPVLPEGSDCACQQWQKGALHWDLKNLHVKAKHESNADQAASPFFASAPMNKPSLCVPYSSTDLFLSSYALVLCFFSSFFAPTATSYEPGLTPWAPAGVPGMRAEITRWTAVFCCFLSSDTLFFGEGVGVSLAFSHVSDSALF